MRRELDREQAPSASTGAGEHADEIKSTTCYMCACRCGIRVYLKDGSLRYIEGNPKHPVNAGVICAKGAAGIMQHYSPARLSTPLKRVGERGAGEFEEISWDEALRIATQWLGEIRASAPQRLAFFTGRDQSQALTAWWAQQFGTVNYAAHGGFCSVNMAAAGLYTIGGAFWEFGEPDWDLTRYFMLFGVAEDHDSNPIKRGLGKLKSRQNTKFVSINPVRSGYSAIADEWIGLRPGTDGLFVMALIHELLAAEQVAWQYLARYTNATWLVIQAPGTAEHGLFAREPGSRSPLCFDLDAEKPVRAAGTTDHVALVGHYRLADGTAVVPAFQLLVERYLSAEYAPAAVADRIGITAATIERIAAELAEVAFAGEITLPIAWTDWTGKKHDHIRGRPIAMHAMRGISAHTNGFQTCRAIHLLQLLLGSIDVPGGFRYKPPYPRQTPPTPTPAPPATAPGAPLGGPPLGFPTSPMDLLVDEQGQALRLDKAFSWEAPLAIHGQMHMVIHNAAHGDPYPIDTLFLYMANMAWNSAMNIPGTLACLTAKDADSGRYKIPHIIYSDAYYSETVAYADLVLPDTTYLERWDCISLLDRPIGDADGVADAIRQPVIPPDRDVRAFQSVLLELGARLGLPGMVNADGSARYPGGYPDYLTNHVRADGRGPLAGWRGEDGRESIRGDVNPQQLDRYIEHDCFWREEFAAEQCYYKFANKDYLAFAHGAGWLEDEAPIVMQVYSETLRQLQLAAEGHGERLPPAHLRERLAIACDPLPAWHAPFSEHEEAEPQRYPIHAISQRPMHMYHSWGGQNAWLRQITASNAIYMHHALARRLGLKDGDWAWLSSVNGRVKGQVCCVDGVNCDTIWTWNAIGKRAGAWGLDHAAPEVRKGFLLNHLIPETLPRANDAPIYANADPVTGQAAWFDLRVAIEKCDTGEEGETAPQFSPLRALSPAPVTVLRYGASLKVSAELPTAGEVREFIGNRTSVDGRAGHDLEAPHTDTGEHGTDERGSAT